ncbi:transmembrane 4 L6 family member 4-like isoform X2 [Mixophyes fleayi]|uniref:transmembrane 4 L6 family member 4-like isoform X2 n=1 Tax=Mixophyes fleayi TaxID=3061075 RepID=UPI003F4D9B58
MCSGGCAKCLGISLIPLAILCALANILLFFPAGRVAEKNEHISREVFYLGGLIGSGVLMIFPALVFLGLKNNDCCGCCGNESCGKRFAMFSSIIFAAIGVVGAGYNFIISAVALNKGPICFYKDNNNNNNTTTYIWGYPFVDGKYEKDICTGYPENPPQDKKSFDTEVIITWNLTLFSMLLIMGAVQAVLCAIQVINGLIGTICGDCKCCGCCGDGPV